MNIFALSSNPVEAARQMVDKHVVKMPTESCQMLHTNALHFHYVSIYGVQPSLAELKQFHAHINSKLMKPAMLNHPSTIWARETPANFEWLYLHAQALCKEYTHRYGKVHGAESRINDTPLDFMNLHDKYLPQLRSLTPVTIAMADEYRLDRDAYFAENPNLGDWDFVIDSYRNYYIKAKYRFASWKGRDNPSWYDFSYGEEKEQKLAQTLRNLMLKYAQSQI